MGGIYPMNSDRNKIRWLGSLITLVVLSCLGWPLSVAASEVNAQIGHEPLSLASSGIRIELAADIQDAEGVDLARVYFKAQREANYLFVPMRVAGEGGYSAVLPAPSAGVGAVEYQILVRNLGGVVYKTQTYSVDIEDGEAAVVENNEPIEVFTELAEAPDVVHGFTDNIALDAVESAAKYGVVAGLTSQAGAGTTAGAVGGTSGGTVTAAGGAGAAGGTAAGAGAAAAGAGVGTTVATVAAATAAVAGGVVAATDGNKNEPPEFSDSSPLALPVPENTTGPIGDPVTAMDSDDDTLSYSLDGADAGAFEIDGSSGQLRVAASTTLDYETRVDYSFEVVASDGDLTATRTVNVNVMNLAPAFADSGDLALSVPENTLGKIGNTVTATDPAGGDVTYRLEGEDADSFKIDASSGQLSVPESTELDFEAEKKKYKFAVVATDPGGLKARLAVDVTVTDEKEGPVFTGDGPLELLVAENTVGVIEDGLVEALDPDGDRVTYRLEGEDADSFKIDASSGQLSVPESTELDFEAEKKKYKFAVVATDSDGLEARRVVVVTVTDEKEGPVFTTGDGTLELPVAENTVGVIKDGLVEAQDPDGDRVTYRLEGEDADSFKIDASSGQLSVPESTELDFEAEKKTYRFTVVATDSDGLEARRVVVVTVTDENEGPVFTTGDGTLELPVAENTVGVIKDGLVEAQDPDGDRVTYRLEGEDADSFKIDASSGQLSVPESTELDFEAEKKTYRFTVVATDSDGLEARRVVVVTVTDEKEGPVFTTGDGTLELPVAENTVGVIKDGLVEAQDPDGDRVTYRLEGEDADSFKIDASSGQLSVPESTELDFEAEKKKYKFAVVATDSDGLEARRVVVVTVTDENEGPVFTGDSPLELSVAENTVGVIKDGLVEAQDPDGDRVTYRLEGEDADSFKIDASSGQLSVPESTELDFEAEKKKYKFAVVATDSDGLKARRTVILDIRDLGQLTVQVEWGIGKFEVGIGKDIDLQVTDPCGETISAVTKKQHECKGSLGRLDKDARGGYDNNRERIKWEDAPVGNYTVQLHYTPVVCSGKWCFASLDYAVKIFYNGAEVEGLGGRKKRLYLNRRAPQEVLRFSYPDLSIATSGTRSVVVEAPDVTSVSITSDPGPDNIYTAGETVEASVRFDSPVAVSGAPRLRLGIGNASPFADLAPVQGKTSTLSFRYAVASGDQDIDGISIGADALQPNGGTIAGATALSLGAHAIRNATEHIVDARVREAEKAILEDALAAQGRAHLASVTDVIGERFRAGPAAPFSLRDRLRLGSGLPAGAPGADALAMNEAGAFSMGPGARSSQMPGLSGGASPLVPGREAWPSGMADTASLGGRGGFSLGSLFGNDFAIPLNADQEEPSGAGWTLWGAHDLQSFRAATDNGSYDGDLRSLYLGIDGRIGDSWLAGVALSRSRGEIDYGFEVDALQGEGALRTRLSSVYPYLHGELASGMEVWGIAGFGSGKATLRREEVDAVERSDLGLGLGSMGLRQGLREFGSLKLSLLADAGLARLWTGGGSDTLDALSATVGRVRVGVEGEHDLTLAGGALQPFWRVSGRYDGGDGVTGGGLELATGVRYRSERLEAQVQGRWLTMHSVSSQEEFGASASLRINARANGLGFAASLSPRWGAAEGSGAIWREDLLRDSHRLPAQRANPWSMDGRLEYGFALPRMAGVLKPFGETRLAGESSARQRFGLRFDRSVNDWSLLGVELGLGRVGRPTGGTDHAIDLTVEAWF